MINNNYLLQVFNVSGVPSIILSSNAPVYTIMEVNEAYLRVSQRTRKSLVGQPLFEAFPDNPNDKTANGVFSLNESLQTVMSTGKPHKMALQKYDIPVAGTNIFEEKYWKPENIPVLNDNNEAVYILHTVQDATDDIKKLQQLIPAEAPKEILANKNGIADAIQMKQQIEASEKKYRYLFENNPAPMYIWDFKSLRIIDCNEEALKMYGYTKHQFLQLAITDIRPEEDQGFLNELANELEEDCETDKKIIRQRKSNGEIIYVHSNCSIIDYNGRKVSLVQVNDVTGQKEAQDEIARQKKFNEDILNNIPSDIAVFDSKHNYLFLNSNAIKDDETRQWMVGKNDFDYCQEKGISNVMAYHRRELFNKAVTTKSVVDWIDKIQNKEGESRYIFRKFYPYFENEKLKYVIGYGTDITERKKAEIELIKVYEEKNTILESIGDAFFAVDKKWTVTYWNYQAEKILRRKKSEILGRHLWEVFPDAIYSSSYQKYNEAIEKNHVVHFEDFYETFGKWYEVSAYPSVSGLSVYFKDITQRKLMDQRIKSERNLLRTLIDNLPDTIYFKDKDARRLISNRVDYTLLGADSEAEVLGKSDIEVFPNDTGIAYHNDDLEILKTGKPLLNSEECFSLENNKPLWLLTTKLAIKNEQDEIIGLLGIGRDITERKMAEEKLKELNKQLERHVNQLVLSNAELEQFAYVASHDLQEPLRMVTSFLTKLEKKYNGILDDTAKRYVHFAVDGAARMRQIILDLLEFSKIGREEDKLEDVNLNELVGEILMLQRKQIQEKKALIKVGRLPVLKTFGAPMRQIFQNLINNSLKYSDDKKSALPQIGIAAIETKKYWQFTVQDNGIGIDAQYFNKIFLIFQRLHNSESYSGTGVGLAITKKIVENLGGKIWVESEEGRGSTFHFTILKQQ